jgi:hypothetical protein
MQRGVEFDDGEYVRNYGKCLRRTFIKITSLSLYIEISNTRQVADPEGAAVADVDRRAFAGQLQLQRINGGRGLSI